MFVLILKDLTVYGLINFFWAPLIEIEFISTLMKEYPVSPPQSPPFPSSFSPRSHFNSA